MGKLVKQKWTNAGGERKIYGYMAQIPKAVIEKANIDDDDEIIAYEWHGDIIISKKYHCTCMECGFEWDSGKPYSIQSACPRCKVGDIHYDINGGNNDNQKQRTEEDA